MPSSATGQPRVISQPSLWGSLIYLPSVWRPSFHRGSLYEREMERGREREPVREGRRTRKNGLAHRCAHESGSDPPHRGGWLQEGTFLTLTLAAEVPPATSRPSLTPGPHARGTARQARVSLSPTSQVSLGAFEVTECPTGSVSQTSSQGWPPGDPGLWAPRLRHLEE